MNGSKLTGGSPLQLLVKAGQVSSFLLFLAILVFGCTKEGNAFRERALCKHVIDGDTIVLADGRKVRYLEINAPEVAHNDSKGEPLGRVAARFNRRLVEGRVVELLISKRKPYDRFGRVLAHVFLPNGKLVSELLVRNGLAHVCFFGAPDKYAKRLLAAQKSAIIFKRGIWGVKFTTLEPYYIGNKRSLRFHRPWCPLGRNTAPKNRIIFKRREDAFMRGFCRCKRCLP